MDSDDLSGRAALATLQRSNLNPQGIQVLGPAAGSRTAQYVAVNDAKKDLMLAMADMSILEMSEEYLNFDGFWEPLVSSTKPSWAVIDANWSSEVLTKWAALAKRHGAKVAFEPVSTAKSRRLFSKQSAASTVIRPSSTLPNHSIDLVTPNRYELSEMYSAAREVGLFESAEWWHIVDSLELPSAGSRDRLVSITDAQLVDEGIPQQSIQLLPYIPCIMTKLGSQGVLLTQVLWPGDERLRSPDHAKYILGRAGSDTSLVGGVYMRLFPPAEIVSDASVVSVNGAGDTLLGVVVAGLAKGKGDDGLRRLEDIIPIAQRASARTLKSYDAVSGDIASLGHLLESP